MSMMRTALTAPLAGLRDLVGELRHVQSWGASVRMDSRRRNPYPANHVPVQVRPLRLLRVLAYVPVDLPVASLCVGATDNGQPFLLDLNGHVLVSGAARSGKSNLLKAIAAGLALRHEPDELLMLLVDDGGTFRPLGALPHLLAPLPSSINEACEYMAEVASVVRSRSQTAETSPVPVVVLVDNLPTIAAAGGRIVASALATLFEYGPATGIYCIASAPAQPDRTPAGSLTRSFSARLLGSVADAKQARLASGIDDSKAEKLSSPFEFIAVADRRVSRFQAAYATDVELAMIAERLNSLQAGIPGKLDGNTIVPVR